MGSGDTLYVRKTASDSLAASNTFPGTGSGSGIESVDLDPANGDRVFVTTEDIVFATTDGGATWVDITSNLDGLATFPLRSAEFVPAVTIFDFDRLLIGSTDGIYGADARDGFTSWKRVGGDLPGSRFPTTPVQDLVFDPVEGVVAVGTLGRGAWALGIFPGIGFLNATQVSPTSR